MNRKVLIGILVVSLSANLGLIGYLVGKSFGSHWHGLHTAAWTGSPMDYLLRPLGRERVAKLVPTTEEHRKQLYSRLGELKQAQRELYLASVEEPFSVERIERAQTAFNELFFAAKKRQDRMWLAIATQLTPDERQTIMARAMPKHFKPDRPRRSGDEAPEVYVETANATP